MDFLHSDDIWKFIKAKDEHDNPDAKSDLYKELEPKEQTNEK